MDTENRWPQARAQNNIYRLNRRPTNSSRKPSRTREGAGGSTEWHSWSQTCPGQGTGSLWLWEGGGGQTGLPASASKCLSPWLEQRFPLVAPCTGEGPYTRTGNSGERRAALAQIHLHQFSADSENNDKEREASWLHTREVSLWQGQVSAHKFQCKLHPLSATNPNISHPRTKALPLTQQLSGCLGPMPTGLKTQSCPSSRATVPAPALIPPAL